MSLSAGPPGPAAGPGPISSGPRPRRSRPALFTVIMILFLAMPMAELAVIIAIGRVIGGWQTIALLVLESALGAWLVRREGATAWRALQLALQTGRMPARELTDAALVLIGGVLLLTPGFVTDLMGFLMLLPMLRPITRRWLQTVVERRLIYKVGIVPGQVR